ncbi:DNA repair protein RadA [Streptomyces fumanus]
MRLRFRAWLPVQRPTKDRPSYRCTECGWQTAKWLGRCPECQAWGTIEEYGAPAVRTTTPGRVTTSAVPIGQVDGRQATARSTGVPELDRVLGGGLVPGAVVLLAGEPGVGKSTLLLDVAAKSASEDRAPVRHGRGVGQPGSGCAPTGSAPCTTICTWPPRPIWPPCWATWTR